MHGLRHCMQKPSFCVSYLLRGWLPLFCQRQNSPRPDFVRVHFFGLRPAKCFGMACAIICRKHAFGVSCSLRSLLVLFSCFVEGRFASLAPFIILPQGRNGVTLKSVELLIIFTREFESVKSTAEIVLAVTAAV